MTDWDLIDRARALAIERHGHETRKGTSIPYFTHLMSVAALVWEHGGTDEQVAAAFLHDLAEDAGGRHQIDALREHFPGTRVADIVAACSDSLTDTTAGEAKEPWLVRKARFVSALPVVAAEAPEALPVIAADKLHNVRTLVAEHREAGDDLWRRFNADRAWQLWYHTNVAELLVEHCPGRLTDTLTREVGELVASCQATGGDVDEEVAGAAAAIAAWQSGDTPMPDVTIPPPPAG